MVEKYSIRTIITSICLAFSVGLSAQMPFQTRETAKTLPHKHFEISVIQPTRYGVGKKTELMANPFIIWKHPNLGVKHLWYHKKPAKSDKFLSSRGIYFSTLHTANYPTMSLKFIQNRNIRNYIPAYSEIPQIIALKNELRISTLLKRSTSCEPSNFVITYRLGIQNAFEFGNNTFVPINQYILYRETEIYKDTFIWYTGFDIDGRITNKINFIADLDFYAANFKVNDWSVEHKAFIYWNAGRKKRLLFDLGYKVAIGSLNNKLRFFIFPVFDVLFLFKPGGRQKGLFENGVYDPYEDRPD